MPATFTNDLFMRALKRQPTQQTPVWLMRQAGRYLPEYVETRRRAGDFMSLCRSPELATEVVMQPLERYRLDAAILFSDILTIPDAMGLGLSFGEGEGPRFARPVRDELTIKALRPPDVDRDLRYVSDAVTMIKKSLDGEIPLIGFSGSPFTLACYMVDGSGSKEFHHTKRLLFTRPDLMVSLLNTLVIAVGDYLSAQIEAGADVVMLFDSWGGILSHDDYIASSLTPMQSIITRLRLQPHSSATPIIVFSKGGGLWLDDLAQAGADAVGVDWTIRLSKARQIIGERCAIQGNIDPAVLFADPEHIAGAVRRSLDDYASANPEQPTLGHIFNLGHGISQHTPAEHVHALVDTVRQHSRRLNRLG